jgi:BMFP domain-containing protein YqiC
MDQQEKLNFLEKENQILHRKLEMCAKWMRKEIEAQIHKIAKRKVSKMFEV